MLRAIGTIVVFACAVVGGIYCVRTAFEVGTEFEEGLQAVEEGHPDYITPFSYGQREVQVSDNGLHVEQTESVFDTMRRQNPGLYGDDSRGGRRRDRDER